jgi:hypothetical protein
MEVLTELAPVKAAMSPGFYSVNGSIGEETPFLPTQHGQVAISHSENI